LIQRTKKLENDSDVNAKILEEIINEITGKIPTEDDYRTIKSQKKTIGAEIPPGVKDREIIADEVNSVLAIRIGKKMYKIADLTEL